MLKSEDKLFLHIFIYSFNQECLSSVFIPFQSTRFQHHCKTITSHVDQKKMPHCSSSHTVSFGYMFLRPSLYTGKVCTGF